MDGFEAGAVDAVTLAVDDVGATDATEGVVTCGDETDAVSSDCVWFQFDSCEVGSGRVAEKAAEAFHISGGGAGAGTLSPVIHPS